MSNALEKQEGGDHYKKAGTYQPWNVILAWNLEYWSGTAVAYVYRWRLKGNLIDLKKAVHTLQHLIEIEEEKALANQDKK